MKTYQGFKGICVYILILLHQAIFAATADIDSCSECQISEKSYTCGYNNCCCIGLWACCMNKNLTDIPKLPTEIKYLNFSHNKLTSVSSLTFENITEIKKLILEYNDMTEVSRDSFTQLSYINVLNLNGNININKRKLSKSFYSIQKTFPLSLYLNNCNITEIDDEFFNGLQTSKVEYLSLRDNLLVELNEAAFKNLTLLKTLDLSNNVIKQIPAPKNGKRVGHKTLEVLILSNNDFVHLPPSFCDDSKSLYPELKFVNLSGNILTNPHRKSWLCLTKLQTLDLSKNVLQFIHNDTFADLVSLQTLDMSNMMRVMRQISSRAFNNPHLQYLHFERNHIIFTRDSGIQYEMLFAGLPNLIYLNLGHNNMRQLDDHTLNRMLSPLSTLETLDLEDTKLTAIPNKLLCNFRNLSNLNLGKNEISWINASDFGDIKMLRVLYLHNNLIQEIEVDSFSNAIWNSLDEVNLSDNPFSCALCGNMWFIQWAHENSNKLKWWPDHYKCYLPYSRRGKLLTDFNPKKADCKPKESMVAAYVTICVFIVIFLISGFACYRGRWYIQYWIIKLRRERNIQAKDTEREGLLQGCIVYDAYVIYHDEDFTFLRETLLPLLENEYGYKLFVRDRDQGQGSILETLCDGIYNSNSVIALISRNFMKDQWCEFQLDVSLDLRVKMKKHMLLLVTNEDIDRRLLSKAWCVLLTKTPTAEWCDKEDDIKRKLLERQIRTNIPKKGEV